MKNPLDNREHGVDFPQAVNAVLPKIEVDCNLDGDGLSHRVGSRLHPSLLPSPTSPPPPDSCSICAMTVSSSLDERPRICLVCRVCVHISCYGEGGGGGVNRDGDEEWRCRYCASRKTELKACVFCPLTEGALTRVTTTGKWAHVICCLFIPEVSFVEPQSMSCARVPTEDSFKALSGKTCSICDKEGGVCRPCDWDNCQAHFHVTCAQALGLLVFNHHADNMIKFMAFCLNHRPMVDDGNKQNYQWLSENSSALSVDDIMSVPSASRKIVKKLIYRLAKDLAKSCPHAGTKGSEVNAWYNEGLRDFFHKHPNLNKKGVSSYIRNCGLGFYHGSLKRKLNWSSKLLKQSKPEGDSTVNLS